MNNLSMLVGRLVSEPQKEENSNIVNITIAVPRDYKNENGEYETDFIPCTIWPGMADRIMEYCHKGDLIGIKGRLKTVEVEGVQHLQVVAEKVTFLSSTTKGEK